MSLIIIIFFLQVIFCPQGEGEWEIQISDLHFKRRGP